MHAAHGGGAVAQSVALARQLKAIGVELIDVSSGALVPKAARVVRRRAGSAVTSEHPFRDGATASTGEPLMSQGVRATIERASEPAWLGGTEE